MNGCPFCNNNRKDFLSANGYNADEMYFYENGDFSISADLSPLVIGHILAIPKQHYTCFGAINNKSIIRQIKATSELLLGTDDLLLFEHGAVIEDKGGASVDHAHLHIMPRPENLSIKGIDNYIKQTGYIHSSFVEANRDTLQKLYKNKQPYIYFSISKREYIYMVEDLPHQFIRMIFQPYCQLNFNWRETYMTGECRNRVKQTIEYVKLKKAKA